MAVLRNFTSKFRAIAEKMRKLVDTFDAPYSR